MINLGDTFDRAVLTQAGIDPDMVQAGTLTIDFIPETGPTTIRYTAVSSVDAVALRGLISQNGTPPVLPDAADVDRPAIDDVQDVPSPS